MRKTRIFQKNAYITIDFSNKSSQILQLSEVTEKTDEFSILLDLGKDKKKKEKLLFYLVTGN